jgi:hypothetical protein
VTDRFSQPASFTEALLEELAIVRSTLYWLLLEKSKGAAGIPLQDNRMVGPPSSWSSRDQEESSWQARSADRPYIGSSFVLANSRLLPVLAIILPSGAGHLAATTVKRICASASRDARLRSGGEMLFKAAFVLLIAWLLGVLGVYRVGTLVHVLLLVGLMLFLLAALKARDAAVPRGPDSRPDK